MIFDAMDIIFHLASSGKKVTKFDYIKKSLDSPRSARKVMGTDIYIE